MKAASPLGNKASYGKLSLPCCLLGHHGTGVLQVSVGGNAFKHAVLPVFGAEVWAKAEASHESSVNLNCSCDDLLTALMECPVNRMACSRGWLARFAHAGRCRSEECGSECSIRGILTHCSSLAAIKPGSLNDLFLPSVLRGGGKDPSSRLPCPAPKSFHRPLRVDQVIHSHTLHSNSAILDT